MSEFTDRMEAKAREIAAKMEQSSAHGWQADVGNRTNVKPWYSPRSAYEPGAKIVLIGANPGGDPLNPPSDANRMSYESDLHRADYNAYLDESWDGARPGESKLQKGVRTVFKAIYGSADGDGELRRSVCFNTCPLRTKGTSEIPPDVWRMSVRWCLRVCEYLNPGLIICNGIGARSPLNALQELGNHMKTIHSEPLGTTSVRYGVIRIGDLDDVKVLGIPHLSRTGSWKTLPRAVASVTKAAGIDLIRS